MNIANKFIVLIVSFFGIFISVYIIGIQVSYIILNKTIGYTLDFNYLIVNGSNAYFYLLSFIALYFWLDVLINLFFSKKERARRKEARRMTKDEKIQFNHLLSGSETKKGLQRISFNSAGKKNNIDFNNICKILTWVFIPLPLFMFGMIHAKFLFETISNKKIIYDVNLVKVNIAFIVGGFLLTLIISKFHLRDIFDDTFDSLKKFYNEIIFILNNNGVYKFNISDDYKLNTKKKWKIGEEITYRRGGLPILTYKNMMYVDSNDNHTLIIGTTNSGKTYSLIHPMIENLRMAGESMLINDLKGELYKIHKHQLKESGYEVRVINFVEPKKSICWNPLGLIIKKYREAQNKNDLIIVGSAELLRISNENKKLKNELKRLKNKLEFYLKSSADETQIQKLNNEIEQKKLNIEYNSKVLPKPDFSEAFELLKDIANTLTYDANVKEPFWNNQAAILIEGLVAFLLEEKTVDEKGEETYLPEEMINLKSIKILLNQGLTNIGGQQPGKEVFLLKKYLDNYREPTDQSVLKLGEFFTTAQNTRGSITSVFADKLDIAILNDSIVNMTGVSEFDFNEFNEKKLAVFIIVHDEKKTYYPLVTIFIKQFYEEIIKLARKEDNQRLKYPVNIVYDEFGISPALKDVDSILAASRSRGVRMHMVIQDYSQLDKNYGKEIAKSIKNNVMNTVYLLGGDIDTLTEISKRAGDKLVWNKEKGYFETTPVISTSRLSKLSLGEALVLRQRKNPILTRYYPYNKFNFYKNNIANSKLEERTDLKEVLWFDINKAFNTKVKSLKIKEKKSTSEQLIENVISDYNSELSIEELTKKYGLPIELVEKWIKDYEVSKSSLEAKENNAEEKGVEDTERTLGKVLLNKKRIGLNKELAKGTIEK
ncbi:MAG: type IV secretory system conjugative DNA transfer family protein [Erysipelotrichaceae bacterium]|nr:type IV secretory system conjugative DNA transfer family protein [Erysipelotrichaceae bacterium]